MYEVFKDGIRMEWSEKLSEPEQMQEKLKAGCTIKIDGKKVKKCAKKAHD